MLRASPMNSGKGAITAQACAWTGAGMTASLGPMKALILGGTGKVGGAAVLALREMGVQADAAARTAGEVRLDIRDAVQVEAGARGYDAAFLITPLGEDEPQVGTAAVAALRRAGVERIGYLAIHNLDAMRAIPHFETKRPIRDAVLAANGFVLGANFFMDNDAMALPAMTGAGVYPLPIGSTGVYSVASGDIGLAAARALASGDWDGQVVPVCGPERLTGPSIAANWSEALGRPVAYGGDAVDSFVAMLSRVIPGMGDWEREDFRLMMEVTQAMGCLATDDDLAASRAIIGREPTRHRDFIRTLMNGAPR